jgi:hypothetical protein
MYGSKMRLYEFTAPWQTNEMTTIAALPTREQI